MNKQTSLMIDEGLKKECKKRVIDENKSFSCLVNDLLKNFLKENGNDTFKQKC